MRRLPGRVSRVLLEASHRLEPDPLGHNAGPVSEELDGADLVVRGKLPDDLAGVYMRNGPNPMFEPIEYTYPFDGDGMVHAVYFEGGRARYRNRFIRTRGLAAEERAGRAIYGSVANPKPVDPSLLEPGDPPVTKNVANINVISHGGHYLALYEGDLSYEISRELETLGEFDFHGAVGAMAAHPRKDARSGDLHFFNYDFTPPYLTYYVADAGGKVITDQPIDLPGPTMFHDFVITERHVVFFNCPVVFDLALAEKGESPIQWHPELGTKVVVLDRADPGAKPRIVETDPFFVFHFVNAFDRSEQELVVDFVRHDSLTFGTGGGPSNPVMHRAEIDLSAGTAAIAAVGDPDQIVEFPRMDDRVTGRRHRYGYSAAHTPGADADGVGQFEAIARFDFDSNAISIHDPGPMRYPGEPCFVPRDGGTGEEDGYLVSFVYDAEGDRSELVFVDAGDFEGEPLAAVELPGRVPFGLHGNWMPIADG